jgi:protein arginine N-methyltransferase 1
MAEPKLSRSEDEQVSFEETGDFANYFVTYGYLYHQKEMLEDRRRMDAYYNAIMNNKHHFEGKVVLDVGAGSGILSIWSALAGAKKVYGVEATQMCKRAQKLVNHLGLADRVTMVQQKMEDLVLPEKVDVIISEWMGYLLLRESMLDSVIVAKEKFLKPDGVLYPSFAWIDFAPIYHDDLAKKKKSLDDSSHDWSNFIESTQLSYKVDFSVLTEEYHKEQEEYFLGNSQWYELRRNSVVGTPGRICELDLNSLTIDQIRTVRNTFNSRITTQGYVTAWAGWFGVEFRGSESNPANKPYVALDTHPSKGYTHWGQQVMWVNPAIFCHVDDVLQAKIEVARSGKSHRLLEISIDFTRLEKGDEKQRKESYAQHYNLL